MKKIGSWLLIGVYVLACCEISIRLISAFVTVYSIEMLDYAKDLKVKSAYPEISHEHRPNATSTLMGVEVALNSLGHRNAELQVPKPADERRVHVIGSSIALGWGVPEEKTFAALVEQRLNAEKGPSTGLRYRVINAGIGNYNAYYAVELFKRQMDATKPDVVVLQYYINDAEPNPKREDNVILRYSVFAAFVYQHIKAISAISTKSLSAHYQELYLADAPDWQRAQASIRELKALADANGIAVVALLVPELHDFSSEGPYPPIYDEIGRAFESMSIHLVNTFPGFRKAFADDPSQAWAARHDPHPNVPAHGIIADALYDYLAPRID